MTDQSGLSHEISEWDTETLTELIWTEMRGTVPRPLIRQVLAEVKPKFEDARIKTFVPIFIHRQAITQLRAELVKD